MVSILISTQQYPNHTECLTFARFDSRSLNSKAFYYWLYKANISPTSSGLSILQVKMVSDTQGIFQTYVIKMLMQNKSAFTVKKQRSEFGTRLLQMPFSLHSFQSSFHI